MNNDIYTNYYETYILTHNTEKTTLEELKQCKKKKFDLSMKIKQCPISLENFKENDSLLELPCGHYFLESKIKEWLSLKTTCPVCRYNLRNKDKPEIRQQFDYLIDIISQTSLIQESNTDAIDIMEIF